MQKTLCIIGGSGYVGFNVAKIAAAAGIKVISVSRSGKPANKSDGNIENITWIKGDAMNAEELKDVFKECHAVVHTIGTLIDTSITKSAKLGEPGTYEQMNRDSAKKVGDVLNSLNLNKKMVYLGASKAPPFLPRYLSTKFEAEEYLRSLPNIKTTALRPGFIYSAKDKSWTIPLKVAVNIHASLFGKIYSLIPPNNAAKSFLGNFDVDSSVSVESVATSALVAAFSANYNGKILFNNDMDNILREFHENGRKIRI